jgi:hypothetical protein
VVTTTVEEPPRETTPADGARHGRDGISPRSVPPELGGVQAAAGSHQGFQAFQRALFADELRDIVGLYVDRPADAVFLFPPSPACRRRRGAWARIANATARAFCSPARPGRPYLPPASQRAEA